jgi:EAL domain-containing protein (putative c-di-GMP-specific phosphodiesterase class I)
MDLKYNNSIPIYHEVIEDIKSLLVNNSALGVLYINCSKINKIEKKFGKKLYDNILSQVKNLVLDIKNKEMRANDIVSSDTIGSDGFLIFLDKKREDKTFYPTDIDSLCNRVSVCLNNSIFPIIFPYLRGKPRVNVGYAIVLHNPLIKSERLVNKLIEDAKLMSQYNEFKRLMHNKEKIQELIIKESIRTLYQPIVSLSDSVIIGYEALSRGPEGTEFENPYLLFDSAAEAELLFELDRLCRKKALINASSIKPGHRLFINCFPTAVHDPEFRDVYLKSFLNGVMIRPVNIVLEVTEREAIENYELFKEAASYYSGLGFSIAVDDTGTGYSGLETLFELKPDFIKIDISIVRNIDKNKVKQELAKALIAISKELNSSVIAEGIETEEELYNLRGIGVDIGQGFLFAKPGPAFPDIKL